MSIIYTVVCWGSWFLGKIWMRLHVVKTHPDLLPKTGPLIIAPTHVSYFDPPLIASVWWPHQLDFFASKHLFKSRILKFVFDRAYTHSVDRDTGIQGLRQALKLLGKKKTLVLFPEGTRSRNGKMGPLKKGISKLSEKAQCPVVPVVLSGLFELWPPGKKIPFFFPKKRVQILIGKPIAPCVEGEEEAWMAELTQAYVELQKLV